MVTPVFWDFLQFLAQYIIAGFLLGYLHVKLVARNSPSAAAVAFVK